MRPLLSSPSLSSIAFGNPPSYVSATSYRCHRGGIRGFVLSGHRDAREAEVRENWCGDSERLVVFSDVIRMSGCGGASRLAKSL